MKRSTTKKSSLTSGLLLILACLGLAANAVAATVTTDKMDYPPLSDVYIDGAGWSPGAVITVHIDQINPDGTKTPVWDAAPSPVADANGAFTVVWYIWSYDFIADTLQVSATGLNAAGAQETATTVFTDTGPGHAPVNPPTGGFGIEGDLYANTPNAGEGDWAAGPGGTGGSVLNASGQPIDEGTTIHFVDDYASGADNNFAGGYKVYTNPNDWTWTSNPVNDKVDINNALVHVTTDAQGNRWLIVAGDRLSDKGAAYIDFEFLQNTLITTTTPGSSPPSGGFVSYAPAGQGGRTENDFIVTVELTKGGEVAGFYVRRWQAVAGVYQYVDYVPDPLTAFAAVNSTAVPSPYSAFGAKTYARNTFAEAAVNLTALIGKFNKCQGLEIKTVLVKTKESQSITANIVDFISPIQVDIRLGVADAGPDQEECTSGTSATFTLSGKATPSPGDTYDHSLWSVVEGTATIDSPSSLNTTATVSSSSAKLSLTVYTKDGCIVSDEVVLTVKQAPKFSMTGSEGPVCPNSTGNIYSVEAGPEGTTYAWSIEGNGAIEGAKNAASVSVTAGSGCDATFTVKAVITSGRCQSESTRTVLVKDVTAPVITVPAANLAMACYDAAAVTAWAATASATDNCGGTITVTPEWTAPNGKCDQTVTVTFTATDPCGNVGTATKSFTVDDNTAPVITVPAASLSMECYDAALVNSWAATASATDNCGGTITVTPSWSAPSGKCDQSITVTFTASDTCGNVRTATKSFTVDDNTAPVITLPAASLSMECYNADAVAAWAATASATDNCGGTITVTPEWTAPTGKCDQTVTVTFTAKDACGNTATQSKSFTVDDNTAPVITVPAASLSMECYNAEAVAAWAATASATDNCGGAITVTPSWTAPSGKCDQTVTVTFTARDACGNVGTASKNFTVDDNTAPVITVPAAPLSIQRLDSAAIEAWAATATATDNCIGAVPVRSSYTPGTSVCGQTILVTFTATDACGNVGTATKTFSLDDTTPPQITCPADKTVECNTPLDPSVTGQATATDNSGRPVTIGYTDSKPTGTCSVVIDRTWTATDDCGNTASCTQKITVQDTTAPLLIGRPASVIICDTDAANYIPSLPTAQDNCGTNLACVFTRDDMPGVTFTDAEFFGTFVNAAAIAHGTVTFEASASDDCGNTSTCTWSVTCTVCEPHCTFTQGYWGHNVNDSGKGPNRVAEIETLLAGESDGIQIGWTGRSIKIMPGDGACIARRLPAGGPSLVLPLGDLAGGDCWAALGTQIDSKTLRFRNNLLGQAVSLALNLRYDQKMGFLRSLADFVLSESFTTWSSGSQETLSLGKDCKTFRIPTNVLSALDHVGPRNVGSLVILANRGLGGQDTYGATLTEIGSAVTAINEAFDECRIAALEVPSCE